MSTLRKIALVVVLVLAGVQMSLSSSNGITGRTLKSAATGCSCHSSTLTAGVAVVFSGPTSVAPGQTVSYTLTISGGPAISAGCDIAVRTGTLAAVDGNLQLLNSELTHTSDLAFTGGSATFSFHYTAPSSPGVDSLYATGLSDNANGSKTGDQWNFAVTRAITVSALPIQLSSFTAIDSHGAVNIHWTTASEINNYGFVVERSASQGSGYAAVSGVIPGHGTSIIPHDYSFVDNTAPAGTWYYRLKQIDLDQSVTYYDPVLASVLSGVSMAHTEIPVSYSLQQNYPNPFNPSTMIRYGLPVRSSAQITVYSTSGQEVARIEMGEQDAGFHEVRFDASALASGVYLYRIRAGAFVETRKMMLVR
jgi:hypothetical protein